LRRASYAYRFSAGVLQRLNGTGKVLWEESLGDITGVERRSGRHRDYLKIQWPRRSRYIELGAALDQALRDPEPKETADEESTADPQSQRGRTGGARSAGRKIRGISMSAGSVKRRGNQHRDTSVLAHE